MSCIDCTELNLPSCLSQGTYGWIKTFNNIYGANASKRYFIDNNIFILKGRLNAI